MRTKVITVSGQITTIFPTEELGKYKHKDFVIEQLGIDKTTIAFQCWSADLITQLDTLQPGQMIDVYFYISSRQFNGKWYTDCKCIGINDGLQK
jgi:hypothetical protein